MGFKGGGLKGKGPGLGERSQEERRLREWGSRLRGKGGKGSQGRGREGMLVEEEKECW